MRLGDALQVNSDVAGKVVHAIFGFCDIRNFTDCTEVKIFSRCISFRYPHPFFLLKVFLDTFCFLPFTRIQMIQVLQVDVVKLVNEVASIVHESVVKNLGAPNKNIGDAFLVVES